MTYKVKSAVYFASLVLAIVIYSTNENSAQEIELAQNTIENVSADEVLN